MHVGVLLSLCATSWMTHIWLLGVRSDFIYDGALCSYYLKHKNENMRLAMWTDLGLTFNAWVIDILNIFNSPTTTYAILQMILFPLSSYFIFLALRSISRLSFSEAFISSLFYACNPFVSMWPSIVFFTYSFLPFLFYVSWYLYCRHLLNPSPQKMTLALIFLVPSFYVKSILLFAPLLFFTTALCMSTDVLNYRTWFNALRKSYLAFLLSAVFWFVIGKIDLAQGPAQEYNKIAVSRDSLKEGFYHLWKSVSDNMNYFFGSHMSEKGSAICKMIFCILIVFLVSNYLIKNHRWRKSSAIAHIF